MKKILFLTLATSLVTAPIFAEELSPKVEPVHAQIVVEANKDATGTTDVKTSLVKNIISNLKAETIKTFVAEHKVALAVGTAVTGFVYAAVRRCPCFKSVRQFFHMEPKEEVRTADLYL